jgi:hypothetical protein
MGYQGRKGTRLTVPPNSRAANGTVDSPFSSASRASSHGSGCPKLSRRTATGEDLSCGWWLIESRAYQVVLVG